MVEVGDKAQVEKGVEIMKRAIYPLAALGLLTLLILAAVLYDILTDGDRRLWRNARYPLWTP